MWFIVGEDAGKQGRDWVLVVGDVALVQVQVQCRRGWRVQVVCGQEHPAGFSQQLQTNRRLTLPLGPDEETQPHVHHSNKTTTPTTEHQEGHLGNIYLTSHFV